MSTLNYTILMNHCIFFMIVLLNLNSSKYLIKKIFCDTSEIIDTLLEIIKLTGKSKFLKIKKILCHLFFDEYIEKIFTNYNLLDLYILNNSKFTQDNTEIIDKYSNNFYMNILNSITYLNMTYNNLNEKKLLSEGEERSISI